MAGSLKRILRIRHLVEEQARLELERETQRLRQAQAARIHVSAQVHQQREQLAGSFVSGRETGTEASEDIRKEPEDIRKENDWVLAEAALEFSSWNQMQLEQWCIQEAERVAPLAEQYQRRRQELLQVEKLVERQTSAERIVQDHRDQAEADAWFQIETRRRERSQSE